MACNGQFFKASFLFWDAMDCRQKARFLLGHQTWLAGNALFRDDETPANETSMASFSSHHDHPVSGSQNLKVQPSNESCEISVTNMWNMFLTLES